MATQHVTDLMVCRAVRAYNFLSKQYPHEALAEQTGEPEKVCYRAMERAFDRGLIEYGVSLRTGWLTAKGKALLAADE